MKVELTVGVYIDGNPMWMTKKEVPQKAARLLSNDDYSRILNATEREFKKAVKGNDGEEK